MGFLEKIGGVIFEILAILLIFVIGLLVTIYATQAHNQCKLAIEGKYNDVPDSDIPKYQAAKSNLQQIVWIGWTIVSLSIALLIIFVIVAVFFLPEEAAVEGGIVAEEAAAAEAEGIFSQFGNVLRKKIEENFKADLIDLIQQQNELERKEKKGLYFHVCFGGWIMTSVFFIMLGTVFFLGIYAAMASVKLGNTQGKHGQGKAQVAAILGIVPFSIFIVWLLADSIYKWYISSKISTLEKEEKQTKQKLKESISEANENAPPRTPVLQTRTSVSQPKTPVSESSISGQVGGIIKGKAVDYLNSEEGQKALSSVLSKGASLVSSAL